MTLTTRFLHAARGLRAPEVSETTPPAGGGAPAPAAKAPVFLSEAQLAEHFEKKYGQASPPAAGARPSTAAPAAKKTPPAKVDPEPEEVDDDPGSQITGEADDGAVDDEAAGDGRAPAGGEDAPEGETPEQTLARLKAEKAALEQGGESDPVKAEIAKLRTELEALKAAKPVDEAAVPAAVSASKFKNEAELDAAGERAAADFDWAEQNAEGWEGEVDGKPVKYTAEQMAALRRNALKFLTVSLPAERRALTAAAAAAAANKAKYPTHFNAAHPDSKDIAAIFAEIPAIKGNHAAAAEILAGRRVKAGAKPAARSTGVPPVTHGNKAPVKVAPAVPTGAGGARPGAPAKAKGPVFDYKRASKNGSAGLDALAEYYAEKYGPK